MESPSLAERFDAIVSHYYFSSIYDNIGLSEWLTSDLAELETIINAELQRRADEKEHGTLQDRLNP